MARYLAIGEVPGLKEEEFKAAFDRMKKWRFDRQSWVVKAYMAAATGKLVIECETPERSRFEDWLAKTGWPIGEIQQVNLIHEAGAIWPV